MQHQIKKNLPMRSAYDSGGISTSTIVSEDSFPAILYTIIGNLSNAALLNAICWLLYSIPEKDLNISLNALRTGDGRYVSVVPLSTIVPGEYIS